MGATDPTLTMTNPGTASAAVVGAQNATSQFFYGSAAGGQAPSLFNWLYQEGTPTLKSEIADTYSLGFTFSSPVKNNPWLKGLNGSVDWYSIKIANAIEQQSLDYAAYLCYGTKIVNNLTDAIAQANTPACQNLPRVQGPQGGGVSTQLLSYANLATIKTSGIDVSLNYALQFADIGAKAIPGGISVGVNANILEDYQTKASPQPFDPWINWVGSLGPNLSGTNPGAYTYRVISSFNYFAGPFNVSLRWNFDPPAWSANYAQQKALYHYDAGLPNGSPLVLAYSPLAWKEIKTQAYNRFDLSGSWQINDQVAFRAGIDNLFDALPEITGATKGTSIDETTLGSNPICKQAKQVQGCTPVTSPSLPNNAMLSTNAGYYDTLGRRFYVGVKLSY
jgi:outer membrane receptor protein involved in Fe transport